MGAGTIVALAAPAAAETAILPPAGATVFDVLHNGLPVGSHRVEIADRGGRREIIGEMSVSLIVLGAPLYAIRQRYREVWSADRLETFESETTEDDASFWVKGRAVADGFDVQSRKERYAAPAGIMVATYWRPEICRQNRLIEPKRGRLREQVLLATRPVTLTSPRGTVDGEEYRIRGILNGACSYDRRGSWLGAWFDKAGKITYRVAA